MRIGAAVGDELATKGHQSDRARDDRAGRAIKGPGPLCGRRNWAAEKVFSNQGTGHWTTGCRRAGRMTQCGVGTGRGAADELAASGSEPEHHGQKALTAADAPRKPVLCVFLCFSRQAWDGRTGRRRITALPEAHRTSRFEIGSARTGCLVPASSSAG